MNKRINVILPEATIQILDRVASRGNRSRVICEAVLHFVQSRGKENLQEQLRVGYQANAADNLRMAAEWFPLEEYAWKKAARKGQK